MNASLLRWSVLTLTVTTLTLFLAGCVVAGGGYGYDGDVGVGIGYYEPVGGVYGDWAPGYRVGPYRDGGHGRGDGGSRPHSYRPAGASRPMPSIPGRSRGSH
jgi:hypothetical protein